MVPHKKVVIRDSRSKRLMPSTSIGKAYPTKIKISISTKTSKIGKSRAMNSCNYSGGE